MRPFKRVGLIYPEAKIDVSDRPWKNVELTCDLSWLVPYDGQLIIDDLDSFQILNQILRELPDEETWYVSLERQDTVMKSALNAMQLRIDRLVKPGFGRISTPSPGRSPSSSKRMPRLLRYATRMGRCAPQVKWM